MARANQSILTMPPFASRVRRSAAPISTCSMGSFPPWKKARRHSWPRIYCDRRGNREGRHQSAARRSGRGAIHESLEFLVLGIRGKLVIWRALAGIAQIDEESKQSTLLALSSEPKFRRLPSTADALEIVRALSGQASEVHDVSGHPISRKYRRNFLCAGMLRILLLSTRNDSGRYSILRISRSEPLTYKC